MNEIVVGDAKAVLSGLDNNCADLVLTSPPYDDMRTYNGSPEARLPEVGGHIFRVLRPGGVAVLVIQDQTRGGAKTLTSFRTAVDWVDRIGFRLFETCIYHRQGVPGKWWNNRFRVDHEFILIFVKGEGPKFFSKEHLKIPAKYAGRTFGKSKRATNGEMVGQGQSAKIPTMKCPGTIWHYTNNTKDTSPDARLKRGHPAPFPNKLASDHIRCWTTPGDLVIDPFVGSGTTCVEAKRAGRRYFGIDVNQAYCNIAMERLRLVGESQAKEI